MEAKMPNFIDIHCHLLPNVDDGPAGMQDAIVMAEAMVAAGYAEVVATPHFNRDFSSDYRRHVERQHQALVAELKRDGIPLSVRLGAEITLAPAALQAARERNLPTLGGTSYILLELPFGPVLPQGLKDSLFTLQAQGYQIILAHPERMEALFTTPGILAELRHKGVLFQVNLRSLSGAYGSKAEKTAKRLLMDNQVHLLASDCHTPFCFRGMDVLSARYAHILPVLMEEQPRRVLGDLPVTLSPYPGSGRAFNIRHFFRRQKKLY